MEGLDEGVADKLDDLFVAPGEDPERADRLGAGHRRVGVVDGEQGNPLSPWGTRGAEGIRTPDPLAASYHRDPKSPIAS